MTPLHAATCLLVLGALLAVRPAAAGDPVDGGLLPLPCGGIFREVHGSGPAVVLLHDGLLHRETWDGLWAPLAERFRVVRYDRRGYGKSPVPTERFSDVDDLAALLGHLSIERAALVGCSAGGLLALDFALAHPERVARIVLEGAVVSGMRFSEHFRRRNQAAFRPVAERGDVAGTIAAFQADPYLIRAGFEDARRRFGELLAANPQNLTTGRNRCAIGPDRPALLRLGEIKILTLILVGESDIPRRPRPSRRQRGRHRGERAGHHRGGGAPGAPGDAGGVPWQGHGVRPAGAMSCAPAPGSARRLSPPSG